jgi:hypothetical protein
MEIEGLAVDPQSEILPGDLYLAKRNTGWHLLTCARVVQEGPHHTRGYVVPQEPAAYCYDLWECLKVVSA